MNKLEKQFDTDTLLSILEKSNTNYSLVLDEIEDNSRWQIIKRMVFKDNNTGEFWETSYSEGATEMQDEAPFEYHDGYVYKVEPVQITITEYQRVRL